MYLVGVLLMTAVLPLASIYAQFSTANTPQSLMMLVGTWFVFWCAGVRLLVDGSLQFFRPKFTLVEIVGIPGDDALPILRELGVVNLAVGLIGVMSKVVPQFLMPVAIIGAISYGVTGARHAMERGRNGNATTAMISDMFVSAVLALYVIYFGLGIVLGLV